MQLEELTDEQRTKVAENWPLVCWGIGKVHSSVAAVVGEETLYDAAVDALIHAVVNHDPARGALATLFSWRYFRRVGQFAKRIARRVPVRHQGDVAWARIADGGRPVEDVAIDAETYAAQLAAISTLSDEERDLLTRKYIDGESMPQTCERLGVSRGTIQNRIEEIREKLNTAD